MLTGLLATEPMNLEAAVPREVELVRAARAGDVQAFESLYRLYCGKVMGLCLRMTRRHDLAEDCVQQTFIRAWRKMASFEGRSAFGTWLHRIAVNEVLMQGRSRATRYHVDAPGASEFDENEAPESPASLDNSLPYGVGEVIDVERALASLPEGARHVVVLQTVYGYSHEEVADMLGIAVGTCKAQLHRGRRLLRERLGLESSHE